NLVSRIAEEYRSDGKIIEFMSPVICMCSTMNRIDPQHLLWTLENLVDGNLVNQIIVNEEDRAAAKLSLDRMLSVS
ncbi:MAG: quinolinate synthase NadA, partial [Burkholderiales bacterium]